MHIGAPSVGAVVECESGAMLVPFLIGAVLVVLALGAFVVWATSRRPVDAWRQAVREGVATLSAQGRREALADLTVQPRRVGLESLLADEATSGSAYLRAETIPGWEGAQALEERMVRWQERRFVHASGPDHRAR